MFKYHSIIKYLLWAYAILFIYSIFYRSPHGDDSWLGEHAFWQSKLGYVKSELMHGITSQEIRFLCHHKLFTLQGAFLIKCFGFSLYVLKSLNLIYLVLFLIIFYFYFFKKKAYQDLFLLFILMFMSFVYVFDLAFVYRPEFSTMTIGLISYIFLEQALLKQKHEILFLIASGLFAGLAVANHLNGLIFPIAGFLVLVVNKKYFYSILFGLSILPTSCIYFYDFTSEFNFKWWSYQLNETPSHDRLNQLPYGLQYLNNLLKEHFRFFHCPREIFLSTFFITVFLISYKYLKEYKFLISYTLLLMISLAILAVHKEPHYMIPYLPYLFLLSILSIYKIWNLGFENKVVINKFMFLTNKNILVFFFLLYITSGSYYNIQNSLAKFYPDDNRKLVEKYLPIQTKDCNIIAPMNFIFNEINNFHMIQGSLCYDQMQNMGINVKKGNFLMQADKFGIDYIILNPPFIKRFQMDQLSDVDFQNYKYEILKSTAELLVLKKY